MIQELVESLNQLSQGEVRLRLRWWVNCSVQTTGLAIKGIWGDQLRGGPAKWLATTKFSGMQARVPEKGEGSHSFFSSPVTVTRLAAGGTAGKEVVNLALRLRATVETTTTVGYGDDQIEAQVVGCWDRWRKMDLGSLDHAVRMREHCRSCGRSALKDVRYRLMNKSCRYGGGEGYWQAR